MKLPIILISLLVTSTLTQGTGCSTSTTNGQSIILAYVCGTCAAATNTVCTTCATGISGDYYFNGNNRYCTSATLSGTTVTCVTCRTGYYGATCTQCPANVASCTSATAFVSCNSGYQLINNACTSLPTGCATLTGTTPTCTACLTVGFFGTAPTCTACLSNCATCTTNANCTACNSGYIASNNACVACPSNCSTCTITSGTTTTCTAGACVGAFYITNANSVNSCTACPTGCSSCTSTTACQGCLAGFFASGGVCSACTSPCKTCSTTATTCTSCVGKQDTFGTSTCYACPSSNINCNTGACITAYFANSNIIFALFALGLLMF